MTNGNKQADSAWEVHFDHYDPADEGRREALLALGNGNLVSRAASPDSKDDSLHYPGTYRVGCYNELTSHIQGKTVSNVSVVNLPNWLPLTFRINSGDWFALDKVTILDYRQTLHMRQGLLSREIRFCDRAGRESLIRERRFVSMAQPELLALSYELTSVNWDGDMEIRSGLDGKIINNKVRRYEPYNRQHLEMLRTCAWADNGMELLCRTNQSNIHIALAARTKVRVPERETPVSQTVVPEAAQICSYYRLHLKAGETVSVEKTAALFTSQKEEECSQEARKTLEQAPGFNLLFQAHEFEWEQLWQRCQLELDQTDQLSYFRLHMFHILQNFSPHTVHIDAGVPPSGWQGEEYHGQVFWDELFIFPFLTLHFPDSAKALLCYRYRRLDAARQMAKDSGYKGAMFPWRSAVDGFEETPAFQLNPISGNWMKDHTCLQRHVGVAIAYNIWHYVQATDDKQFLSHYGAELFLEIARFWASKVAYNKELDRYEIHGVAGPDEYHTHYPDAQKAGISNNTYTNIMVVWTLLQARHFLQELPPQRQQELRKQLALDEEELAHWEEVSRKMRVIFSEDGSLRQFEGFEKLKSFDLNRFRTKHGEQRTEWALEAMGDAVERYQIAKQADTPMLLYLFSPATVISLLHRLGYQMDEEALRQTVMNHLAYTAHESSLSYVVFAGALAHLDPALSWKYFKSAQQIDLSPDDKGAAEGIHLGAMGGTLSLLQHHYLGLDVTSATLKVTGALPDSLSGLRYFLLFRGKSLVCDTTNSSISVQATE